MRIARERGRDMEMGEKRDGKEMGGDLVWIFLAKR